MLVLNSRVNKTKLIHNSILGSLLSNYIISKQLIHSNHIKLFKEVLHFKDSNNSSNLNNNNNNNLTKINLVLKNLILHLMGKFRYPKETIQTQYNKDLKFKTMVSLLKLSKYLYLLLSNNNNHNSNKLLDNNNNNNSSNNKFKVRLFLQLHLLLEKLINMIVLFNAHKL